MTDTGTETANAIAADNASARIKSATSLVDLRDALRAFEAAAGDSGGVSLAVYGVDMHNLPTFDDDGREPDTRDDVWSWDQSNVLRGTGRNGESWAIEPRHRGWEVAELIYDVCAGMDKDVGTGAWDYGRDDNDEECAVQFYICDLGNDDAVDTWTELTDEQKERVWAEVARHIAIRRAELVAS